MQNSGKPAIEKLVGKEEDLGRFIYQLTSGKDASDQYMKTTEEIIQFTASKFKSGGDSKHSLFNGATMTIPKPTQQVGDEGTLDDLIMKASMVLAGARNQPTECLSAYSGTVQQGRAAKSEGEDELCRRTPGT